MKNWIKPEAERRLRTLLLNKRFGGALLVGYAVTGVLIALLVPLDIFSENTWAMSFVGTLGEVIPAIEKVGNFSKLPELAQFHMAVMWVLSPMIIVPIAFALWVQPRHMWDGFLKEARSHRFRALLMVIVPPLFFVALFMLSPGKSPGKQLSAYLGTRMDLAIWTLFGPMVVFVFVSAWLGMLKVIKPLLMAIFLRSPYGSQLNASSTFNKGE